MVYFQDFPTLDIAKALLIVDQTQFLKLLAPADCFYIF